MTIFAADASGRTSSAAVVKDGELIFESFMNKGLTHSETFLTLCDTVFSGAGCGPADIDCYAVTRGPGSFTGLRIGMGVVKGLAFPFNTPCAAVSTLEALAKSVLFSDAVITPVIDARRDRVYCAAFLMRLDGELVRLLDDAVLSLDELKTKLLEFRLPVLFVGDARESCGAFSAEDLAVLTVPGFAGYLRASFVAEAAASQIARGETVPAERLAPVYLQQSQAERELERKGREDRDDSVGE